MNIMTNIAKIYLNADKTIKKVIDPFISRGANSTVQIVLVGPFDVQNSQYVNFELDNSIEVPTRYMTLVGTENSDDTDNEDWGVWVYTIGGKILAGAAGNTSEIMNVTFTEFLNSTLPSSYEFIGFQSTEAALNINFPNPTDDQYAGVGNGTTLGTSTCYLAVNNVWVNQNKTVLEFESDNSILRTTLVGESQKQALSVDPSISVINDEVDNTNLDVIFANISDLQGRVLTIETLLGVDGTNFVKSNFNAEYFQQSQPSAKDTVVIFEEETSENKRVTLADLLESGRTTFIGTFETAASLTCPDVQDLLCQYPDNTYGPPEIAEGKTPPFDPNDRFGFISVVNNPPISPANPTGTRSQFAYSVVSVSWVDTGLPPTDAKDVAYDSSTNPITNANNLQDMGDDHGNAIKANQDKSLVNEQKTQNLNTDGDIANDIQLLTTKDIVSVDLDTGTGSAYQKVIQALIAEYGRNNSQDTLISGNASDIADRLLKDFSVLLNKSSIDNGDLLVLWDGVINKNISFAELVNTIETQIQFYQGYYVDLAALKTAIPIGQAGWYATLGDVDTQAVWDVEGGDWVPVASKLYYTLTAGTALEVRVTTAEGQISTINSTLINKEDIVNKTDDVLNNFSSSTKYASAKGVYDLFDPIKNLNNEDRIYGSIVQSPGTADFVMNSEDITLQDGRKMYIKLDIPLSIVDADARFSIDGGSTFKDVVLVNGINWNPAVFSPEGKFTDLIFNADIDKWLLVMTEQSIAQVAGLDIGWTPDKSVQGNYNVNLLQNIRLDNLEEGSLSGKSTTVQEVAPALPITAQTTTLTFYKILFAEETIESNDRQIIDIDAQTDIVLKEDSDPGYRMSGNFKIVNKGSLNSTSILTFYLFKKGDVIALGNELDTVTISVTGENNFNDRSKSLIVSNDFVNTSLGGFPVAFEVYYTNDVANPTDIIGASLTAESLFTGIGISSSENVSLTDPAETRSGVLSTQSEHNLESVADRKDLLETGKVQIANYVASGRFAFNNPDIVLNTNKAIKVKFSEQLTDLDLDVELSIDNGVNYYDVEFKDSTQDLKVKNVSTEVIDLYWTGTKFVCSYVDSAIDNASVPYAGATGQFTIPKNGVPIVIQEETQSIIDQYEGRTLEWLVSNPDFRDGTTGWTGIIGTISESGGILSVESNGSSTTFLLAQNIFGVIGNEYYIKARVRVRNAVDAIRITSDTYSTGIIDTITSPTVDTWYELSGISTLVDNEINIYASGTISVGDIMEVEYAFATSVPDDITTVAEMEKLLTGVIVDRGLDWAGKTNGITIPTVGKNKFDKSFIKEGKYYNSTGALVSDSTSEYSEEYIRVFPQQNYFVNKSLYTIEYDSGKNFIQRSILTAGNTFVTQPNTSFMRISQFQQGLGYLNTLQLELGTVATAYEKFKPSTAVINGGLHGIDGVHDDLEVQRFDRDFNDVVKNATGWAVNGGTNAYRFNIDLSSILGYKSVVITEEAKVSMRVGDKIFARSNVNEMTPNDIPYTVGTWDSNNNLYITVPSTITNSAQLEAYLQANDVEFIFELATYLPRTEANDNLIPVSGQLLVGPQGTYSQVSNGVIGEFKTTSSINVKSQVSENTSSIVKTVKDIRKLESKVVERVEISLNEDIPDDLITPNAIELDVSISDYDEIQLTWSPAINRTFTSVVLVSAIQSVFYTIVNSIYSAQISRGSEVIYYFEVGANIFDGDGKTLNLRGATKVPLSTGVGVAETILDLRKIVLIKYGTS